MKKRVLLFLRFFLILVTILVMTYSQRGLHFPEPGYIIAVGYLISNLLLYRVSEKYFSKTLVSFLIFLFDIVAISLAVYFAQGLETDFYLIYLLVIFIASVSQNVGGSLPIAIVASIFYGWIVYRSSPGVSLLDSKILIRVPFLFMISLISTYWARSMRSELRKKDELEKFNIELRQTVDKVSIEEKKMRLYTEKVINSVPSGVIATRGSGIITTLNPEAERILGLRLEEVIGVDIKDITQLKPLWQKMNETMNTKTAIIRDEVTIKNTEDEVIPIGMSISPITDEDQQFSGSVVIFVDLSEKMELQEKLKHAERLSYLGKMASWVAHEIRNPLTAIDGFAKLLTDNTRKDKAELYCTEIQKGTLRINYIIDDILAFARTERKINHVDINLRELIQSITSGIIGTQIMMNTEEPAMIRGDYESIRRVFINLINNSIEAMDKHRELRINFSPAGKMIVTEISDIGKGIPEEDMKNLFIPFFSTKPRGTGLGLPIVKKIVEEHKGKIEIRSEKGVGTTCRVYLLKEDSSSDREG
jgi:PAS domain S-box-containing protein